VYKEKINLGGKETQFATLANDLFKIVSNSCPDLKIKDKRRVTTILSFYELNHNSANSNYDDRLIKYGNNLKDFFSSHKFNDELSGWIEVLIAAISNVDVSDNLDKADVNSIELNDDELDDILVDSAIVEIQMKITQEKSPGILAKLRKKLKKLTKYGYNHDLVALNNIILNIDNIASALNKQLSRVKSLPKNPSIFTRLMHNINSRFTSNSQLINNALSNSLPKLNFYKLLNKMIFPVLTRFTQSLLTNKLVQKKRNKRVKKAVKKNIKRKALREQLYHMFNSHDPSSYMKLPTGMVTDGAKREYQQLNQLGMSKEEAARKIVGDIKSADEHSHVNNIATNKNKGNEIGF
jgi:hypothetical protein